MPEIYRKNEYNPEYHHPNFPVFLKQGMKPLYHANTYMLFPGLVGWKQENIAYNFVTPS